MRITPCVLIVSFLSLQLGAAHADTPKVSQQGGEAGDSRTQIATVFGKSLSLEQVCPAGAEAKRRELPRAEFDQWLREYRGRRFYEAIWREVLQKYVEQEKLGVTNEELAAIAESVERRLRSAQEPPADTTFTAAQRKGIMVAWARASFMDWKVCKSLYERYGGRVGIGSLGAWTAFDGQNALLREHHTAGDIKFRHPEIEAAFWHHTKIKNFADAYPEGERLKLLLASPPYLRD